MVELARAFALNPQRSLLFIVFAADARAEINFDMIGRNPAVTGRGGTPAPEISPDTWNELVLIGRHYSRDYRAVVERANVRRVLFRGDQYPFLAARYSGGMAVQRHPDHTSSPTPWKRSISRR